MALNTLGHPCRSVFRCLRAALSSRCVFHGSASQCDSNRSSVVRLGRAKYQRLYPVLLVRPDGSTINIRYKEPRRIMMMPVDITTLSEEERKVRMRRREPKKEAVQQNQDVFEDDFQVDHYSRFWSKK